MASDRGFFMFSRAVTTGDQASGNPVVGERAAAPQNRQKALVEETNRLAAQAIRA
jgi:hypothetical protein